MGLGSDSHQNELSDTHWIERLTYRRESSQENIETATKQIGTNVSTDVHGSQRVNK